MPLNDEKINHFLQRWVEDILPSKEEFFKVIQGKKITIYHGVDPTSPHLHLGHSTNYLLMRVLQRMGHKVVLVIGDFTARIGDPSGRTKERIPLTEDEVKQNYETYRSQCAKILDFDSKDNPVEVRYNSEWLGKLKFEDIIKIASHFTVQQMTVRDMFQKRLKDGNPIGLHEFLYPLMQGYDSVALETDAEIGGNDQLFNMMAGRDLVKDYLNKEKFVITTKLIINPKTGNKLMSKSEGNYVALNDPAPDMYGKVMALPDAVVKDCLNLCTEVSDEEIVQIMKFNERDAKARLAFEIVKMYHGENEAKNAEDEFVRTFSEKKIPSEIDEFKFKGKISILDLLVRSGLASSKSEARRLLEQGGVQISKDSEKWDKITDSKEELDITGETMIKVGKRRFLKILN